MHSVTGRCLKLRVLNNFLLSLYIAHLLSVVDFNDGREFFLAINGSSESFKANTTGNVRSIALEM